MIPTTTIENPSNTLTALNRATKIVTDNAAPSSAYRPSARIDNFHGRRRGDGWRTAFTISSSQRKLIIVTTALQVNPTNPRNPLVINTGIANTAYAAALIARMRANTAAVSSITQSNPEKIEKRGDHPEGREDPGQPRRGVKELVHSPAPQKSEADGDGKHPADRRCVEQLSRVAAFFFRRFFVIVRHSRQAPHARRPTATSASPGSPAAPARCRKSASRRDTWRPQT